MLSKKVCKACRAQKYQGDKSIGWCKEDGHNWSRGLHLCYVSKERFLRIDDPPPENCPFILEHALAIGALHAE